MKYILNKLNKKDYFPMSDFENIKRILMSIIELTYKIRIHFMLHQRK